MKSDFWIDQIPLWGIFGLSVAMVLLSIWIGAFMGKRRTRYPDHESESSLSTIIGASLGLLAFMLAFTFGFASERFQSRKQLLLDEVNTIGKTYLRASLLLEPHRSEVQNLLREYVNIRVELVRLPPHQQLKKLPEVVSSSEVLYDQLWSQAAALAAADRSSEIDALFISSLNEMIDLHNSRLTVFQYRIPMPIWYVLSFITIISTMTVGYQAGLSGKNSAKIGIVLALTFSAVVFLIADLDRATGTVRVNQKPLFELQKKIQTQTQEIDHER